VCQCVGGVGWWGCSTVAGSQANEFITQWVGNIIRAEGQDKFDAIRDGMKSHLLTSCAYCWETSLCLSLWRSTRSLSLFSRSPLSPLTLCTGFPPAMVGGCLAFVMVLLVWFIMFRTYKRRIFKVGPITSWCTCHALRSCTRARVCVCVCVCVAVVRGGRGVQARQGEYALLWHKNKITRAVNYIGLQMSQVVLGFIMFYIVWTPTVAAFLVAGLVPCAC